MPNSPHHTDDLRRLGIEDVRERLELSSLMPNAGTLESPDIDTCCCCKINDPIRPDNDDGADGMDG